MHMQYSAAVDRFRVTWSEVKSVVSPDRWPGIRHQNSFRGLKSGSCDILARVLSKNSGQDVNWFRSTRFSANSVSYNC